jgi:hypothetical protein
MANDLFQRDHHLSHAAEMSNVANTNEILDDLFTRRDDLAARSYRQLSGLFSGKEHYGRNTRLGMSAREAGRLVNRAFSDG